MNITVAAIGRQKAGPETELVKRFIARAQAVGRGVGLNIAVKELPESRAPQAATRRTAEAKALLDAIPSGAALVVLDERGKGLTSAAFAALIGRLRDAGQRDLALLIGGPDGLPESIKEKARHVLSFGPMTLPHQLVRVLVAEQLYRAATILVGHPYHRA